MTNPDAEENWMFTDGTTYISHQDDNLDGIGSRCRGLKPMDSNIDVTACQDMYPYICSNPGETLNVDTNLIYIYQKINKRRPIFFFRFKLKAKLSN